MLVNDIFLSLINDILWNRGAITIDGDENEINSLQTGPNEGSIG